MNSSSESVSKQRLALFDTLRGCAMILMAIYHFCFDLDYFHVIRQNFNVDSFWLDFRALIMTLFTGLMGVGFYLGRASFRSPSYRRRLLKIFFCASLISASTFFIFPQSWIYFGILHFVFIASLLGPWLILQPLFCLPLGLFFILLPLYYRHFIFMKKWLIWTGLGPLKPITEDFSPLFPWFGIVLLGIFIGFLARKSQARLLRQEIPLLSRLGRHSLLFYMLHQLVLFPLAALIGNLKTGSL